uniref:40S ribosomal protein S25 n=1 Tax=Brassica oleracea var. oleracea TaxID=109376 RepID=A0A0D3C2R7_BRAOL
MAMTKVFFFDLKAGQCSSVVEARLLRFWQAKNVKRGGELMWMDLLMVDFNSTMMQVTIGAGRLPQFRDRLHAGTMFFVSGFDVSRCFKLITPYILSDRLRINGSLARKAIRDLMAKGTIRMVSMHSSQQIYTRATHN